MGIHSLTLVSDPLVLDSKSLKQLGRHGKHMDKVMKDTIVYRHDSNAKKS